jgi:EmrB/QacA subfamily drug resistance transporter
MAPRSRFAAVTASLRGIDYTWQVLAVIASGTFMVILDTTIVHIALPRVITIFGSSIDQGQLVLTGYMVALAIVMPATAFASQRWGSKRVYLASLTLFTLGSIFCGAAWSMESLIVARVLQGLGGGMIQPLGMSMLFRVVPPDRRGRVMSIYAMPVMVGPIIGPTIGGYLVEYVDWRWVFFLNVPVGVLGVLMGWLLLRETPLVANVRFDLFGFILAALASTAALLGLSSVPERGWSDSTVIAQLTIAALTVPIFIWWELTTKQPLLNLRLFAIPAFVVGGLVNFIAATSLFGAIFLLPVFLQNVRGLGALETGWLLFPQALASAVAIIVGGRLYDRIGPRPLIVSGLLILAFSTWRLSALDLTTPDSELRWLLVLRGMSMGMTMMPAVTAWLAAAPLDQTADASALQNVLRQLFGAFGTALYATVLHERTVHHLALLSMSMVPDAPAVVRLLGDAQQIALAQGLSLAQGRALAIGHLVGQVRTAATVQAFNDCFLIATVACLIGLIPALMMERPTTARGARPTVKPSPASE